VGLFYTPDTHGEHQQEGNSSGTYKAVKRKSEDRRTGRRECLEPVIQQKIQERQLIPGGPKKRPKICVTVMACILHGAKFPLAHL